MSGSQPTTTTTTTTTTAQPAAAESGGTKSLDDLSPGDKAKHASWTAVQQYIVLKKSASYQPYPTFVIADELGTQLSQGGRLGVLSACFPNSVAKDVSSAAIWATCAADVAAFDINAFGKELQKEGLRGDDRTELLNDAKEVIARAKEVGDAVAQAAKEDPGVAAVVAMGDKAREEWKAYASANAAQVAELAKLQDLVRQDKNGLAGDCVAKTQPAIEKVLKATKWREQDVPVDPNYFYMNLLPKTVESFMAAASWGACAALVHQSGDVVYGAAVGTYYGFSQAKYRRYHRRGPRTLTIAKLFDDESFKPKFASRSLSMERGIDEPRGDYKADKDPVQTPTEAVIAKVVKNGEETTIKFAKDKVMRCTEWRDTNKIQSVSNGNVQYEKKCMGRVAVDNEHDDTVTATAFAGGLAPGVQLVSEYNFPVIGMRGQKFVAAFGIKL